MKAYIKQVTPALAKAWLEGSDFDNRRISGAAADTIDTGIGRTGGDVLHFHKYKSSGRLATIARYVRGYQQFAGDLAKWATQESRNRYSTQELLETVTNNFGIEEAVNFCDKYKSAAALSSPAAVNVAGYLLMHSYRGHDFLSLFNSGVGLKERCPILALRNALIAKPGVSGTYAIVQRIGLIIKAYNLWVKGKQSTRLRFDASTEAFPNPVDS
jgi:hypothetical protein